MNKILNKKQSILYKSTIDELYMLCPETMKYKIPDANVQQAFVLDYVKNHFNRTSSILSIGAYQDTASESLYKLNYNIIQIDPDNEVFIKEHKNSLIINSDLHNYRINNIDKKFDCIIATSVIEHVQNDEEFIDDICNMLNINGIAILTCDFNNVYKQGDKKPDVDYRLYTKHDLLTRLNNILKMNNCEILGDINYDGEVDFNYANCIYTFASYVFIKK